MSRCDIFVCRPSAFDDAHLREMRLSATSMARLNGMSVMRRAREFRIGRWLLAHAASVALGSPYATERMDESAQRGPLLLDAPDWHTSISHSKDLLAAVVLRGARVGVDTEYLDKNRRFAELAAWAFGPWELAWIGCGPPSELPDRFYRIWTVREAAYKAGLRDTVVGGAQVVRDASGTVDGLHADGRRHGDYWITICSSLPVTIGAIQDLSPRETPGK